LKEFFMNHFGLMRKTIRSTHFALLAACAGLFMFTLTPCAHADEWNKLTIITVNEPIQVPHMVLPPGQYALQLLDSPSDRHIVQIFNADRTHLITTILAMPNYRLEPTGRTSLSFWETPPGQPKALRAWFYPGDNFGQEFAYPKAYARQIAARAQAPVPTTEATEPQEMAAAPVTTTPPEPAPEPQPEVAQNTPPPAPAPEVTPAPEPTPAPRELPKTGSEYPLIGLIGLSALGIFALLRALRTVRAR
jgi:LPXTG-motif cell wall-anchored protein